MMKKAILFIFSALTLGSVEKTSAQTFTVDKDTVRMTIYSGYGELKDKVTNTTSAPINLQWKIKSNNLPANWISNGFGICDNQTCINFDKASTIATGVYDALPLPTTMDMKLQYNVSALPAGGPYYITVTLTDKDNTSSTKDFTFEVTNRFSTNIPSATKGSEDVTIYPNPARTDLNVLFDGNVGIKNITVYNLIGKPVTVYKVSGNSANLDVSNIPSGIYFIRLIDAQGHVVATRKFTHQ